MAVTLGSTVTDSITGFTGIATSRTTFLYGCVRVRVQPTDLADGKTKEDGIFDEQQLKENDPSTTPAPAGILGKVVTDTISGIKGMVICRTEYLYGCSRISVQPKGQFEGKPIEPFTVDEPQIEEYVEPQTSSRTGGPGDIVPRRAAAPQRSIASR